MARQQIILSKDAPFDDAPISFPQIVPTLGLLRYMRSLGKGHQYKAFLAGLAGDQADDWEEMTSISRNDPIIAAMQKALGLSDRDVDKAFAGLDPI